MKEFWKKKLPAFLLAAFMLAGTAIPAGADEHNFSPNWTSDATNHWHACTDPGCEARSEQAPHVSTGGWKDRKDGIYHQKVCDVCGQELEKEEHHLPAVPTSTVPASCAQAGKNVYVCLDNCGYQREETIPPLPHTPSDAWTSDTTAHWHICSVCQQEIAGTRAPHTYDNNYTSNAAAHWRTCTVCKGTSAPEPHVDANNDGVCDQCGRGGLPTAAKFTVTFINGGSVFATQSNIAKDAKPSNPGTPSKTAANCSYTFRGWTTANPARPLFISGRPF